LSYIYRLFRLKAVKNQAEGTATTFSLSFASAYLPGLRTKPALEFNAAHKIINFYSVAGEKR
jgi:hypothetical protein